MKPHYLIIIFTAIAVFACSKSEHRELIKRVESDNIILIQNVNIFNGRDSILAYEQDVLIKGELIVKIGKDLAFDPRDSITLIDGTNKVLMPGLIDAHVHLSGSGAVPWNQVSADIEYNLSAYLYAGITTIYDLGGLAGDMSKVAEKVNTKEFTGPTIFNTHIPITVKNSHPIPLTKLMLPWPLKSMVNMISPTIDDVADAPKVIEKYLKNDIDYVKIICDQIPPGSAEMTFEQLNSLIIEAHGRNKKVFVHIGSPENAMAAAKAGADILAHGVWRGKLTPTQADIIAHANIPIIYTIAGFQNASNIYSGNYMPNQLDSLLVPENILSPVAGSNGKDVLQQEVMNNFFKDVTENVPFWLDNFKLLTSRGVKVLVGTDSNLPGTYAGSTYYQELKLLKKLGLSNFKILAGATYLNSKAFLNEPNFGLVGQGKRADLLLINGNPLVDLELLEKPEFIMLRGDFIQRIQ